MAGNAREDGMEPESRYTLVGAVLVALIVAAAFASVWLSRSGVASDFRYYTIHFERQSLEGLQMGGDVNMQGIKVGRVETFSIDRGNINRVNVEIRVARSTPVSTNTLAVVARNLVTGIARINLETPSPPGPELEEVPEDERYPVIGEGTSDFEQIARTANSLVITAEASLKKLDSLLDDNNRKVFSEVLVGVRDLAVGLNQRLETLDRTANSLGETAQALTGAANSFRKSSESIAGVAERVGSRVEPLAQQADATLQDARSMIREVQSSVRDLGSATRTLERDVGALARRTEDAADVGVLEVRATAQELRVGVERLTRVLDRLQDPRAALLGPGERQLGPGEQNK
jgi:phospholipid/cholesterol/gamma-HCH transport system substrate-binding protein